MRDHAKVFMLAAAAGLAISASAQAQVVTNGGFESGSFSGWTQFGDTGFTSVVGSPVHSGTRAASFGPLSPGGIRQTLALTTGQQIVVDFWYRAQGGDNSFVASLGGQTLVSLTDDTAHTAWTNYQFVVTVAANNPVLQFEFTNPPDYTFLDDVAVVIGTVGSGACCMPDGTCQTTTSLTCANIQGAIYRGDNVLCANANCPQPPTGACCLGGGTCQVMSQIACTNQGGAYRGDNALCANANCPEASVGPDVIVGEIQDSGGCCPNTEGTTISPSATVGSIIAYGLGTSSCNIGTMDVSWVSGTPLHPIIPQNMYRLETVNGATRFEQIGQSWSKYAFTALQHYVCAPNPQGPTSTCNGHGGSVLGVGCSDPYTAGRNATQSSAGPRYQCNPFTGDFPDSSAVRAAWPATTDSTSRRLRVNTADIGHAGALYFGECMYVTKDDATYGNSKNNMSYRRLVFGAGNSLQLQGGIGGIGTKRGSPAIFAWKNNGLGVDTIDPNVMISDVAAPQVFTPPSGTPTGDGWIYVGSKATSLGGGVYHYEFAVENQNSDRGVGSVTINFPPGTQITNAGWKQIDAHSGMVAEDATRNAVWNQTIGASSINWASPNVYNAANPTLGSYIRWATMYNFRFDANVAPSNTGSVTLGYYKPGSPTSIQATAWVPAIGTPCYANCDSSTANPILNANDFQCFLNRYAANESYANCDGSTAAPILNANDFQCFLNSYAAGCS